MHSKRAISLRLPAKSLFMRYFDFGEFENFHNQRRASLLYKAIETITFLKSVQKRVSRV